MSRPALLHVVITGLMGSGKSTVGPIVAERLGRPWSDSDAAIEREAGQTGREVALAEGVPSLHAMEAAHLLAALKEPTPAVICAAPSVLEDTKCLEALERGAATLFLDVAPAELEPRQASGEHRRSLAAPLTTLTEMRHRRLEAVRAVGGAGWSAVVPRRHVSPTSSCRRWLHHRTRTPSFRKHPPWTARDGDRGSSRGVERSRRVTRRRAHHRPTRFFHVAPMFTAVWCGRSDERPE